MAQLIDRPAIAFGTENPEDRPAASRGVDARLSFDIPASIAKAARSSGSNGESGIYKKRPIPGKLASTWEGIRRVEVLQKEGIHCRQDGLLFSGRCRPPPQPKPSAKPSCRSWPDYDWYKKNAGRGADLDAVKMGGANDPGVIRCAHLRVLQEVRCYKTE